PVRFAHVAQRRRQGIPAPGQSARTGLPRVVPVPHAWLAAVGMRASVFPEFARGPARAQQDQADVGRSGLHRWLGRETVEAETVAAEYRPEDDAEVARGGLLRR